MVSGQVEYEEGGGNEPNIKAASRDKGSKRKCLKVEEGGGQKLDMRVQMWGRGGLYDEGLA